MQKKSLLEIAKIELFKNTVDRHIAPTADRMMPCMTITHERIICL